MPRVKPYIHFADEYLDHYADKDILFIYEGEITHQIILSLTYLTERKMNEEEEGFLTHKKVFNILIESLQNIYNHGSLKNFRIFTEPGKGLIALIRTKAYYRIVSGNVVYNTSIDKIKRTISEINKLSKNDLREYYKQQLSEGRLSVKGGAGLGFADMARKSENKIEFAFKEIDEKLSFFIQIIKVNKK
ncbi:MAG: SiaB family protein kinase [Bacteroidota bacterium]